MRISDWSSDVCSFDLAHGDVPDGVPILRSAGQAAVIAGIKPLSRAAGEGGRTASGEGPLPPRLPTPRPVPAAAVLRSEEHTSELQSLMRISYAVFCLKKNKLQQ